MKSFSKLASATVLSLLLSGCLLDDGDDEQVSFEQCSAPDANQQLYDYLQEWYFWEQDLATVFDPTLDAGVEEAMASLRVAQDRFSFVMSQQEYEDYQASVFFGYGFSYYINDARDGLVIRYTYDQGSAGQVGLRRGDTITAVGGQTIADILSAGNSQLSSAFGPNENGYTTSVTFTKPDGSEVQTEMTKSSFVANTVLASQVKTINDGTGEKKAGYLVFDSFDNVSEQELNTAFDDFANQNIDELVLDLRYNSGGLIRVARQLSTQIAGDAVQGQIFTQYVHNENKTSENSTVNFSLGAGVEQLNLDQVVVLTTGSSCSASELVINALSPFVNVVTIGSNTCGKPVGMYPMAICDDVVFAINFQTQNAAGFGDYFDGLPVDCAVADEATGDWGVTSDPLLSEGLHYLENGQCSGASGMSRSKNATSTIKVNSQVPDFTQGPWKAKQVL